MTASLVPRPSPSFPSFCSMESGRGPGTFSYVSDHGQGKLCQHGHHVNHKQLCPHTHTRAQLFRVERWQRTKAILCHSSQDSWEDRVLPRQNSEDAQQHFSRTRPRLSTVFLPVTSHEIREKIRLPCPLLLSVLQATGSWARVWERCQITASIIYWTYKHVSLPE